MQKCSKAGLRETGRARLTHCGQALRQGVAAFPAEAVVGSRAAEPSRAGAVEVPRAQCAPSGRRAAAVGAARPRARLGELARLVRIGPAHERQRRRAGAVGVRREPGDRPRGACGAGRGGERQDLIPSFASRSCDGFGRPAKFHRPDTSSRRRVAARRPANLTPTSAAGTRRPALAESRPACTWRRNQASCSAASCCCCTNSRMKPRRSCAPVRSRAFAVTPQA